MNMVLDLTLFDFVLSDETEAHKFITKPESEKIFSFFQNCSLFNWKDVHNNCEARADAVCLLLDSWNIPNYKAWVFSGAFLKNHIGGLKQLWNYHTAALVPVTENNEIIFYIVDPATSGYLQTIYQWASQVTEFPHSYHIVKNAFNYIFPGGKIQKDNWHKRNRQNRKWMIQGLAGINGLSQTGKARLCFNKQKIKHTERTFRQLRNSKPVAF
jgi:hypothetical protein